MDIVTRGEGFGSSYADVALAVAGTRGGQPGHIGHGTASFFVTFVEDKDHIRGGGRTTPMQAVQACCQGLISGGVASFLYEVSRPGAGTDRSHTAGWRYNVCTSCICPC